MAPPVRASLLALAVVLALAPLAAVRPGLPPTLKADEPAYYLMAESLVRDGDLLCEEEDIRRLINQYPYLPVQNLILMSPDGWETVYFGKPYLLSLLAAPLVALAGANGLVSFNGLLLAAMVAMGARYLSSHNGDGGAALFSALFFLLSPAFAYVFWMHPELLNMFAVAASLFLTLTPFADAPPLGRWGRLWGRLFHAGTRPAWAGAALALGIYNKPNLAALALPALYLAWRRRGWRGLAAWGAGAALVLLLAGGVATVATGAPSAYLGMARAGVEVEDLEQYREELTELRVVLGQTSSTANTWTWIFRPPDFDARELAENLRYFFVGRHTGLLPHMPFAAVALLLFLVHTPRSLPRWLILAGMAVLALHFLVFIPINWHGGGGFVGNRYFVMAYPGFLFLVTAVRPRGLVAAGAAVAALLLGSILLTPYGAPVPYPTLQAHARAPLFERLPLELTIRNRIPGYHTRAFRKAAFVGRQDLFGSEKRGEGALWIQGGTPVHLLVLSGEPIDGLLFQVRSPAPGARISLAMGGERVEVALPADGPPRERAVTVELTPGEPARRSWAKPVRFQPGYWIRVHRLTVETDSGRLVKNPAGGLLAPQFFLGAELTFLGTREQNERAEHYRVEWLAAEVPETAAAGELFEVPVRLVNRSLSAWSSAGPLPVKLSYRWLDPAGKTLDLASRRTRIEPPVPPGGELAAAIAVEAPPAAGRYTLVLDLVREHVAWFSRRGGEVADAPVEVASRPAAPATADTPAP